MGTQETALVTNTEQAPTARTMDSRSGLCYNVTEGSPMPMLAAEGPTHIIRYVNPAFCRLFGKAEAEMLGYTVAEDMPELVANGCIALLDRVYRTEDTDTLADQEHTARPSGVYWSYTAWAILANTEQLAGIVMVVADTTASVRSRQQASAMNEALVLSGLRQHELTEQADNLNERLQRSVQETHHRVKNNLQVVSALAELQTDGESLTVPASALQRVALHVRNLANLHDMLTHQAKVNAENSMLDTQVTLTQLLTLLQGSLATRPLRHEVAKMTLSMEASASLSLLVSELVSNAVKHGEGPITVTLERKEDEALLTVCDEGKGFPADFNPRKAANTGLELIDSLVRHDLRGTIAFTNPPEGGACILVTFPLLERYGNSSIGY